MKRKEADRLLVMYNYRELLILYGREPHYGA